MPVTVKKKTITFSDGSELTISQANWDISMRLTHLEDAARDNPVDDPDQQLFMIAFYPRLAACAEGEVPTEEEARQMPSDDLDLWYATVKEMNPKWFPDTESIEDESKDKKKGQRKGGG